MATPQVLLVGNEGASLCLAERGKVQSVHALPPAEDAVAALHALAGGRNVRVLVDVVEEEYLSQRLPPASRRDRQLMLARRLAAAFVDTPWRLALPRRPQEEDPPGSGALLCGLTAPARIRPWLTALRAARMPLAGLYSLPLTSAALLPAAARQRGAMALLSQRPGSGLRMSFFLAGQLQGSRLLPARPNAHTARAAAWQDALGRLRPWLLQAGWLRPEITLTVGLLADAALLETLHTAQSLVANSHVHPLEVTALARGYGCATGALAQAEDALFAACLLQHPPLRQYATASELADFRARGRRRLVQGVAAGCCVALSVGSLALTRLGLDAAAEAATLAAANTAQALALRARQQALPPLLTSPAEGLALRELCRELAAEGQRSLPALGGLSATLAAAPAIRWTQLEWPAPGESHGLLLHGEVLPFNGDYGAALAAIGQLLASLRQRPEVSAAVLRQSPLPAAGAATQVLRSDGASARFTLGLELRATDDASER